MTSCILSLIKMEISPYWGGVIFVPRSVNVNIVQVYQIRRKSLHIFFPFNECRYFVQTTFHQLWNEFQSSGYEIWPDSPVRWVTHTGTIPGRSAFHLYKRWNTRDYKNNFYEYTQLQSTCTVRYQKRTDHLYEYHLKSSYFNTL